MQIGIRVPIHTGFGTAFETIGLEYRETHIDRIKLIETLKMLHENALEFLRNNPGATYNYVYDEAARLIEMIDDSTWEGINHRSIAAYSFPFRLPDHGDVYLTITKTGVWGR